MNATQLPSSGFNLPADVTWRDIEGALDTEAELEREQCELEIADMKMDLERNDF
jgi:hypothetical protein